MSEIFDDELYQLRMDFSVHSALLACDRAIAEHRPLTSMEDACVKLAKLERDQIWHEAITKAKAAGVRVPQWDQEQVYGRSRRSKRGVRLSNDAGRIKRVFLWGEIIYNETAQDFRDSLKLADEDEPLEIHINSDGGSLFESIAIHNLIRDRIGHTIGVVDSVAASGASIALVACREVLMTVGSWVMIHGVRGYYEGPRTAEEMQDGADRLRRSNQQVFELYSRRWKGTDAELRGALADELWLDEKDAVRFGIADRVSREMAIAASIDARRFKYKNTPETLVLSAQAHADRIQIGRRRMDLIVHRACRL